jgi:hypothetical protein
VNDIASQLRLAGLVVLEGRGMGRTVNVEAIETHVTGTGITHEGAGDINELLLADQAVAYIERSGRTWLLNVGPTGDDDVARVWFAAPSRNKITSDQDDAYAVVHAVLADHYGLPADEGDTDEGSDQDADES